MFTRGGSKSGMKNDDEGMKSGIKNMVTSLIWTTREILLFCPCRSKERGLNDLKEAYEASMPLDL